MIVCGHTTLEISFVGVKPLINGVIPVLVDLDELLVDGVEDFSP
jgi:hypothetical protein